MYNKNNVIGLRNALCDLIGKLSTLIFKIGRMSVNCSLNFRVLSESVRVEERENTITPPPPFSLMHSHWSDLN